MYTDTKDIFAPTVHVQSQACHWHAKVVIPDSRCMGHEFQDYTTKAITRRN